MVYISTYIYKAVFTPCTKILFLRYFESSRTINGRLSKTCMFLNAQKTQAVYILIDHHCNGYLGMNDIKNMEGMLQWMMLVRSKICIFTHMFEKTQCLCNSLYPLRAFVLTDVLLHE